MILQQHDEISESETLSEMLNRFRTNMSGDNNLIKKKELKKLSLIIEYQDLDDDYHQLKFNIKTEKTFSNNKLFY